MGLHFLLGSRFERRANGLELSFLPSLAASGSVELIQRGKKQKRSRELKLLFPGTNCKLRVRVLFKLLVVG